MSIMITHWNESLDGPLSEMAMRSKLEAMGYQVSGYTYPPGTVFPDHSHGVDKIDAVLSGQFRMVVQDETVVLEAGDMIEVPRGVIHRAEVVGEQAVFSLDAVKLNG